MHFVGWPNYLLWFGVAQKTAYEEKGIVICQEVP